MQASQADLTPYQMCVTTACQTEAIQDDTSSIKREINRLRGMFPGFILNNMISYVTTPRLSFTKPGELSDIKAIVDNVIMLSNKQVPDDYPASISQNITQSIIFRELIIDISSFPLISNRWIRPLAQYIGKSPCLEIMAGSGILAKALQDLQVNVIATDSYSWAKESESDRAWFNKNAWTYVARADCISAINAFGPMVEYVICSWPYMDDDVYNALLTMRRVNPSATMLYIGEQAGGCTASNKFFEEAKFIHDKNFAIVQKCFQRWNCIRDQIYLVK